MELRRLIREWFREHDFLEAETPIMRPTPSQEPYLEPFAVTVKNERGQTVPGALITSPEFSLKKLLTVGYPRLFELARCFRNGEPADDSHNPEFTMLEWYRANADYRDLMNDTESLVSDLALKLHPGPLTQHPDLDLSKPWERLTVRDALSRYASIDLDALLDAESSEQAFRDVLLARGMVVRGDESFDECFFKVFLTEVEPKLGLTKPTMLYDYPASMAALARLKAEDPRYAERVEVYAGGLELSNGFSELTNAEEQRKRFIEDQEVKRREGKQVFPIDEEFIAALAGGYPPSTGNAMGVDRLTMLLLDAPSIRDVLFFPWN